MGIVSRETRKEDINSEIYRNVIKEIYLQEGEVRACGLATLMKLVEYESDQRKALEATISHFAEDPSEEVRDRILFRSSVPPISNFELDLIENYLNFNCQQIQSSEDTQLLDLDSMKKWVVEAGPAAMKAKKKSVKEIEVENGEVQELAKYR